MKSSKKAIKNLEAERQVTVNESRDVASNFPQGMYLYIHQVNNSVSGYDALHSDWSS
ncbi:hypothetical protein [Geoglobus acetivorans]|uniref:Uncharacterized protein n=1 Tax=Geoglobus acetivorans TaxID=565033 RepID=A0ABZ3H1X0_GEOAI|nr:hypothetical protein [Geoglobus acetivorans]